MKMQAVRKEFVPVEFTVETKIEAEWLLKAIHSAFMDARDNSDEEIFYENIVEFLELHK